MAKALDSGQGGVRSLFTLGSAESDYKPSESPTGSYIQTPQSKQVYYKYPNKAENCYKTDENLKLIIEELSDETKKLLTGGANREYVKALQERKAVYELVFNSMECRDKIEEDRLRESANLLTKNAIGQEKDVVDKSFNLQKVYIGVGALILIVGLIVVLKK
jgi:hypothetical protein